MKRLKCLFFLISIALFSCNDYNDQLRIAIAENDLQKAKDAISHKAVISPEDFYDACNLPDGEIAKLLIKSGVDVDLKGEMDKGRTALHFVNNPEIIELLIAKGANVNNKDYDGTTPLMSAINTDKFHILVKHGADINALDNGGKSVSMHLSYRNSDIAKYIIEKTDVTKKDNLGSNLLFYLADSNYEDIIKILLERGLDLNARNNLGQTPLMIAAENGRTKLSRFLIEQGANPQVKDNDGTNLLMYAASSNKVTLFKYLQSFGLDINSKNNDGNTPLLYNIQENDAGENIAAELIFLGANVNDRNELGRTPLMLAVEKMDISTMRILLNKGADPSAKTIDGEGVISIANQASGLGDTEEENNIKTKMIEIIKDH